MYTLHSTPYALSSVLVDANVWSPIPFQHRFVRDISKIFFEISCVESRCKLFPITHRTLLLFIPLRWLQAHLDQTWINQKTRKELAEVIVRIQAKATDSVEFLEHCQEEISKGKIPRPMIDFWYHGCMTSNENCNDNFMIRCTNILSLFLSDNVPQLTIDQALPKKWESHHQITKTQSKIWNMSQNEDENKGAFSDYFPGVEESTDLSFHSLFTSMAFDYQAYHEDGSNPKFHLLPSCQVPCNNRDVSKDYLHKPDGKLGSMFQYVTQQQEAKLSLDGRYSNSSGVYILNTRRRREKVSDPYLKEELLSNTHMMDITSTGDNSVTRWKGVKTLGDHVSLRTTFDEMHELYKILTVSTSSDASKECHYISKFFLEILCRDERLNLTWTSLKTTTAKKL